MDTDNTQNSITVRHGYWFFFEYGGHQITLNASSWSGRERVWVDDTLVSETRNWRLKTKHQFDLNGDAMEVEMHVVSLATSKTLCTLRRNGDDIISAEEHFRNKEESQIFATLVWLGLGFILGYFVIGALLGGGA